MKDIKSAKPIKGFNIKTKTGVLFGGHEIFPPFEQNLVLDMERNPYRWEITYEGKPSIKGAGAFASPVEIPAGKPLRKKRIVARKKSVVK